MFKLPKGDQRWDLLNHPYLTYGVVTVDANFDAGVGSGAACILVNASTGPVTVTLPPTAKPPPGAGYLITKIDASANAVTVAASGTDTIDGSPTVILTAQYDSTTVVSNGAGLWVEVSEATSAGPVGPTGPTGSTGSTGPTGPTGPSNGAFIGRQTFTASGTYTPSAGTMKVHVTMCGGGGSGAGTGVIPSSVSVGGGGGTGEGLDFVIVSGVPITGGAVVVGAGGAGALNASNSGTASSVVINGTTHTAAAGGGGGGASSTTGTGTAAGGFAGTGAPPANGYLSGENGAPGLYISAPSFGFGGDGGSGDYGIGGVGAGGIGANGTSAAGYGAGGGGSAGTTTSQAGGSGAPGVVIIDEYT